MQNGLGKLIGQVRYPLLPSVELWKEDPQLLFFSVQRICGILAGAGASQDQSFEEVADGRDQHRGQVL